MPIEIERKFLVKHSDFLKELTGLTAKQGNLAPGPPASVRVRIMGDTARLNIKEFKSGSRRQEFEYPIPIHEAEALLTLCNNQVVEKQRYTLQHGSHQWEVDVFEGANAGLILAEIELTQEDEHFENPEWLGEEVTDDTRYYNVCLAEHPYTQW